MKTSSSATKYFPGKDRSYQPENAISYAFDSSEASPKQTLEELRFTSCRRRIRLSMSSFYSQPSVVPNPHYYWIRAP